MKTPKFRVQFDAPKSPKLATLPLAWSTALAVARRLRNFHPQFVVDEPRMHAEDRKAFEFMGLDVCYASPQLCPAPAAAKSFVSLRQASAIDPTAAGSGFLQEFDQWMDSQHTRLVDLGRVARRLR